MLTNPRLEDRRIYQPKVGMHPNEAHQKFIGKPVRVIWQHPSFNLLGFIKTPDGPEKTWECRWFGYVVELDKQIPEDELIRIPTEKETQRAD